MQAVVLVALAIAILLTIGIIVRAIFYGRVRASSGRGRQPRLAVVDVFDLDRNRQLVLVRRDQVEHLVMIGGPNDVVVESGIIRTVVAAVAARDRDRGERDAGGHGLTMPLAVDLGPQKVSDSPKPEDIKIAAMLPAANADIGASGAAGEPSAPAMGAIFAHTCSQQAMAPQPVVAASRASVAPQAPVRATPPDFAEPSSSARIEARDPAPQVQAAQRPSEDAARADMAPPVKPVEIPAQTPRPVEPLAGSDRPALRSQFIQRAAPLPRTLAPLTPRPLNLTSAGFSPRPMTTPKPVTQPAGRDVPDQKAAETSPIDDLEMEMARLLGHPVKLD